MSENVEMTLLIALILALVFTLGTAAGFLACVLIVAGKLRPERLE